MIDSSPEGPESSPAPVQTNTTPQQVSVALPTNQPILTYALLAILSVIFIIQLALHQTHFPDEPVLDWGALDFQRILNGEYYRLFTSMFLHLDQFHIAFNAIALWSIGRSVERFYGHARFITIYLLGGLAAGVVSFFLTRGVSVGASGAIFAIFGAEGVLLYRNRKLFGAGAQRGLRNLVFLALLNLGIGLYSQVAPGSIGGAIIDNWAHVGGFVGGIILSWFMVPRLTIHAVPTSDPVATTTSYRLVDTALPRNIWLAAGIFAASLVVIFVFMVSVLQARA